MDDRLDIDDYRIDKYNVIHGLEESMAYKSLFLEEGKGSRITINFGDIRKITFLDASSGAYNLIFGYKYKPVIDAIHRQLDVLCYSYYSHSHKSTLTCQLLNLSDQTFDSIFYTPSGSLAVEAALSTAKKYTGKRKIAYFEGSYHGSSEGCKSVSGIINPFDPFMQQSISVSFPDCLRCQHTCDLKCLDRICSVLNGFSEEIAALIVEPVQQNNVAFPPVAFWDGLLDYCKRKRILVVFDEIVTGFGRTGAYFAFQKMNVPPDILCVSKGITAGYLPLAATLFSRELSAYLRNHPIDSTYTYGGYPLAYAAGIEVLRELVKHEYQKVSAEKGSYLLSRLKQTVGGLPIVGEVRGEGLMIGIELVRDKDSLQALDPSIQNEVFDALYRKKILYLKTDTNVMTLMPPFLITEEEMDYLVAVITRFLTDLVDSVDQYI